MLQVGEALPLFDLPDQNGQRVTTEDLRGAWSLLFWYPKADTPGCIAQAQGLRDQQEAFDEFACRIVGLSFDEIDAIAKFRTRHALRFDLLSDADSQVGRAFGVAGDDGAAAAASRVSFLVDPEGLVVRRYDVTDPTLHAEDVLDDLEELTAERA